MRKSELQLGLMKFEFQLEKILFVPVILLSVVYMKRLQAAGKKLAEGEFDHRVSTKGMYWDYKKHGENLNSISEGMTKAVDEKMKSERFKTELITNVSHDIKTPLTSIVSFCGSSFLIRST